MRDHPLINYKSVQVSPSRMRKTEVLNLKELFCAAGQIDLILYKQFESQAFYRYPFLLLLTIQTSTRIWIRMLTVCGYFQINSNCYTLESA